MDKIKDFGGMAGAFLLLILFLSLPVIFLLGAAEFSVWALDWIPDVFGIAVAACLMLIPFAILPATRSLAANLFDLASLVFGACLWLYALAFTYLEWGMVAVVIGVLLAGVGVIFTGVLAALFAGAWGVLGNIALVFVFFIGTRILSGWLVHLVEQRKLLEVLRKSPSRVTITQNDDA